MISVFISLEVTNDGWASKRKWNKWKRHAFQSAGEYWRDNILAKHFEYSAFNKYGYQPRTAAYQKYKKEKSPLVKTGDMRRQILSDRNIKATDHNVKIIMRGPEYLRYRNAPSYDKKDSAGNVIKRVTFRRGPDKIKELTTLLQPEVDRMQEVWMKDFMEQWDANKEPYQGGRKA